MNKQLFKYVKSQLDSKADLKILRYQLVRTGWPEEEVDEAIKRVLTKKSSKLYLFLFFAFITLFLIITLISLQSQYSILSSSPSEPVLEEEQLSCEDVEEQQKHDCYLNELSEGFNCNSIDEDQERMYCLRALEYSMLHDTN